MENRNDTSDYFDDFRCGHCGMCHEGCRCGEDEGNRSKTSAGPNGGSVAEDGNRLSAAPNVPVAPAHTAGPWAISMSNHNDGKHDPEATRPSIVGWDENGGDEYVCRLDEVGWALGESELVHEKTMANAFLIKAAPAYYAAVEQMLAYEQAGGDGWWKGFDMLKAAHSLALPGGGEPKAVRSEAEDGTPAARDGAAGAPQ